MSALEVAGLTTAAMAAVGLLLSGLAAFLDSHAWERIRRERARRRLRR
jgi:hypothetical protein